MANVVLRVFYHKEKARACRARGPVCKPHWPESLPTESQQARLRAALGRLKIRLRLSPAPGFHYQPPKQTFLWLSDIHAHTRKHPSRVPGQLPARRGSGGPRRWPGSWPRRPAADPLGRDAVPGASTLTPRGLSKHFRELFLNISKFVTMKTTN